MSAVAKLKSEPSPSSTFENTVLGQQICYLIAKVGFAHEVTPGDHGTHLGLWAKRSGVSVSGSAPNPSLQASREKSRTKYNTPSRSVLAATSSHHSIDQDTVQNPLTFSFGGDVHHVGGIVASRRNFDGNIVRVGGIPFGWQRRARRRHRVPPESAHPDLHGVFEYAVRYLLTDIWDHDVGHNRWRRRDIAVQNARSARFPKYPGPALRPNPRWIARYQAFIDLYLNALDYFREFSSILFVLIVADDVESH
ncbi:hypothetical protein C8F04DRAFT_1181894 [Mycena alexandri]|uniref:Uncharacterized protein n=1 Tax=Mycena alexandri TaxID=1745969 RepID=A0AAD6SZE1_9AGAR|nr:hypothetical protein C8F04DRAFT_1181894 [Mycena alexandri]